MLEWFLIFILLTMIMVLFIKYSRLRGEVEQRAREIFEVWKKKELEVLREEYGRRAEEKADIMFKKWKMKEEAKIREDAVRRSTTTIIGKVGEHLAPLIMFLNYGINLKDVRFIGSPIDFIVFKGLSDEKPEKIIFVEVKSGKTVTLTDREKKVKELVEAGKVEWKLIHLPIEIRKALQETKLWKRTKSEVIGAQFWLNVDTELKSDKK